MSNAEKINRVLERSGMDDRELVQEINGMIKRMDAGEQLELYGHLSPTAILRKYPILNELSLNVHAKEHLAWSYFRHRIYGTEAWGEELLGEMIGVYAQFRYLAIESLFVEMLKHDRLSLKQLDQADQIFTGKAFIKEAKAFKCRHKIRSGNCLTADDVSELLQLGAYGTIAFALDRNAVTPDGLDQIAEPRPTERDRKKKLDLYQRACKLREGTWEDKSDSS